MGGRLFDEAAAMCEREGEVESVRRMRSWREASEQ
jgi:hypothetical protein